MIVGYHVIFGAYGFWLPNDPRGSWSDFVGSYELHRYGRATKTTERRSVAHRDHDVAQRRAAKLALKYPPAAFTGMQALSVGNGFGAYIRRAGIPVWACAILPDHVHLVIGRPAIEVEQVVLQLKGDSTQRLLKDGVHPFGHFGMRKAGPRSVLRVASGRSSSIRPTCRGRSGTSRAIRRRKASRGRVGRS